MTKLLSFIIFSLLGCMLSGVKAQDSIQSVPDNRHTTHALLFGVGSSNLYDTYLSPVTYKGPHLSFLKETLRKTHCSTVKSAFRP